MKRSVVAAGRTWSHGLSSRTRQPFSVQHSRSPKGDVHNGHARIDMCQRRTFATEQGLPTTQHTLPGSQYLFEVGESDPSSGRRGTSVWRHGLQPAQASRIELSPLWLRDHCQCHECVHPETKQRQLDTFSNNLNTDIQVVLGLVEGSEEFLIQWGDGHMSRYDTAWLHKAFDRASPAQQVQREGPTWWDGRHFDQQRPAVPYSQVQEDAGTGLDEWVRQIGSYGFSLIVDAPADPAATESVLARVGPIRNTHYGGFYDFTSDLSSKDTAYTSIELGVHTDTTYFNDPAGLQAFHMLSHTEGDGGHTLLVDGFRAAEELGRRDAKAYETLASVPLVAHSSGNEDVGIVSEPFTVLQHDPLSGALQCVKWNNDDRAAFTVSDMNRPGVVDEWYRAARLWNEILTERNAAWRLEFPLQPGQILLFDNWRVLHGRTAFTGKRRMCGAYISRDDFISRLRLSQFGRDEMLRNHIY